MLLAGCAASRAGHVTAIEQGLAACDESLLLEQLKLLRLTALVGGRALALAGVDAFPQLAVAARVEGRVGRATGAVQLLVQRAVLERLTQAGISAAPFKGPDLARRLYGDLGLRRCADVDVLVESDRLDEAVAVVRTLGYGAGAPADAPWLSELHHRLEHPAPAMPTVEVHWRAEWFSAHAPSGGFARAALERSDPAPGGQGRVLKPADELALLLLVYARDGLVGLRLAVDLAAWWDVYGADVGAAGLREIAETDPPLAAPLAVAALTCQRLVGLPAADLLDLGPARTARGRLAVRLADPFLDEPPARMTTALVDGLLSSRGTLPQFVRRRILPPAGYVALVYGVDGSDLGSLRLRLLRAQHPLRQLAYYARFVVAPPPRPPIRS